MEPVIRSAPNALTESFMVAPSEDQTDAQHFIKSYNRRRNVIKTRCDPLSETKSYSLYYYIMILPFLVFRLRISDGLRSDRALWGGGADTATKPREEAASPGIWRSGEFDLDCDRFAVVPFIQIAQAIGKIFECSVLRQHERKLTVRERHSHAARPRLVVMEV
jgi:hypothetical protein